MKGLSCIPETLVPAVSRFDRDCDTDKDGNARGFHQGARGSNATSQRRRIYGRNSSFCRTVWWLLQRGAGHIRGPLTDNAAERALRRWVIARRISYGMRTDQGSRVSAALASVIETCRQRTLSPWTHIAEVMTERRQGRSAPLMPVAVAA